MTTETTTKRVRKSRAKKNVVLTDAEANAILDAAGEEKDLTAIVKDVKKRKPSARERGEDNKVLRKGRNLSGNSPFQRKYYYFDLDQKKSADYEKAFNAAPGQVRLLMKYMEKEGITTPDDAMIGGDICGGAINTKYLESKIEPAALFAYYRRVMETLGLRLSMSSGVESEGE